MLLQLVLFSSVYILVFSGYYVLVNFLNIMYPRDGFWSFVIFYGTYAFGSLISPFVVLKLNFRLLFFFSTFSFLFLIGFASSYIRILLFIGSFIAGLGNSFIWLIQGIYLSNIEDKNAISVFYSLFNVNMILGNLISLIILLTGASLQIVMFSMLGISGLGCILSIFVTNKKNDENLDTKDKNDETLLIKLSRIWKKSSLLVLPIIYSGIGLNISYQIIPRILVSSTEGTAHYKDICNTIIYLIYGIAAMFSSILWGKVFEINWKYVLYPITIIEIVSLCLIFLLAKYNNISYSWIVIGFLRGIIDYGINNILNITLSKFEKNEVDIIFAFYRLIYSITYLLTAICVGYIPYEYILLICGITCISSSISYIFYKNEGI